VALAVLVTGCSAAGSRQAGPSSASATATVAAGGVAGTETSAQIAAQKPSVLPASDPGARPSIAEITAVVTDFVVHNDTGATVASVTGIKVAHDNRGRWWVSAVAVPKKASQDSATVFLYKDGAQWKLFALGTGIGASELPSYIREKL
jgi:hypothetical protein